MSFKKNDMGKKRLDLPPPELEDGCARAMEYGALEYGTHNWRKGCEWHRPYAALMRHMKAWWNGEESASDSGLSHLDHAAANLAFLMTFHKQGLGVDNRYKGEQNDSVDMPTGTEHHTSSNNNSLEQAWRKIGQDRW